MSEWGDLVAAAVATGVAPAAGILLLGEPLSMALLVGIAGAIGAGLGIGLVHTFRDRWWMGNPWGERDD